MLNKLQNFISSFKNRKYKWPFVFDEFIYSTSLLCYAANNNSFLVYPTGKKYKLEREYLINRNN